MIWAVCAFGLRAIRRRMRNCAGPTASQLYAIIAREPGVHVRIWPPAKVTFNRLAAALGYLPDVPRQALQGCDLQRTDSTYDTRYDKVPLTDQLDHKLRH